MQTANSIIQTTYGERGELPRLGHVWRGRLPLADYDSACVDRNVDKAGTWEVTVTNNVNAEKWAVVFNGAHYLFTTGANPTATSTALKAAIDIAKAPGKTLESIVASAVVDVAKTTILQKDYLTHVISVVSLVGGQTSTFTSVNTIKATKRVKHKAGYFVTLDKDNYSPELTAVRELTSTADEVYGVVSSDSSYPSDEYGLVGDETVPENRSFAVARREEIMVPCVVDVGVTDPVYAVCVGVNKGKASNVPGGSPEIQTLTLAGIDITDPIGGSFDGLGTVTIVSAAGVEADDAVLLAAKFTVTKEYADRFTFTPAGATIIVTAKDRGAHTWTDVSTGGGSITAGLTTAAVAATNRLVPNTKFCLPCKAGMRTPIDLAVR